MYFNEKICGDFYGIIIGYSLVNRISSQLTGQVIFGKKLEKSR